MPKLTVKFIVDDREVESVVLAGGGREDTDWGLESLLAACSGFAGWKTQSLLIEDLFTPLRRAVNICLGARD